MCMRFGFHPWINLSLFSLFELTFFLAQLLQKHIYTGYLVNVSPHTILARSFRNFAGVLSRSEDVHEVWLLSSD